jgi:hypothetical protein
MTRNSRLGVKFFLHEHIDLLMLPISVMGECMQCRWIDNPLTREIQSTTAKTCLSIKKRLFQARLRLTKAGLLHAPRVALLPSSRPATRTAAGHGPTGPASGSPTHPQRAARNAVSLRALEEPLGRRGAAPRSSSTRRKLRVRARGRTVSQSRSGECGLNKATDPSMNPFFWSASS